MMLRRKTFFMLLKNVFLISTIVDCGFFCKRGKRFPYHMNFLGDVYMNLNYHLAGQTWSIPCPCVFSPPTQTHFQPLQTFSILQPLFVYKILLQN